MFWANGVEYPSTTHYIDIFIDNSIDAVSYTFKANNPSYSYCKLKKEGANIIDLMMEKELIRQLANVGIYSFRKIQDFIESAEFADKYDKSDEIESEADVIIDFSEGNPFGTF